MAHFAKLENGFITEVCTINNDDINNLPYPESEPVGQAFIASLGIAGLWLETSYNNNFRGIYAGIGYTYDEENDVFVAPPINDPYPPIEQ